MCLLIMIAMFSHVLRTEMFQSPFCLLQDHNIKINSENVKIFPI
jgi:hypothetical protein